MTRNAELNRQAQRRWYYRNQAKRKADVKARKKRLNRILRRYKRMKGCAECGFRNPAALDFHHRNPKEKVETIWRLAGNYSMKKLRVELPKCDVLCSNCHRILHADVAQR